MSKLLLPLNKISKLDFNLCGGKGANLGELMKIGVPVPNGFVVTTNVYKKFIKENKIKIDLKDIEVKDPETVGFIPNKLQKLILDGEINPYLHKEILSYFNELKAELFAVRSSATAEDAARASWAGQLSSFLNIQKEDLVKNIKLCWASLFNPRAISYRAIQRLLVTDVTVAVIVQEMVNAEVSGIAFTAHPVTKDPDTILIEAGFGLGEAMVSGMVTPDKYLVNKKDLTIYDYKISKQKKMVTRKGILDVSLEKQSKRKLSEEKAIELTKLCVQIENHFGIPQDIEWALEGDGLFILQSRPITTL
ncbi:PEP/pyruvate-binding domain-containing protein [Candidatus Microgenomates bacterium]|nr:PEP/pyruvate-binding domain-containing protein [Candidatus Microgenomates bacterium]